MPWCKIFSLKQRGKNSTTIIGLRILTSWEGFGRTFQLQNTAGILHYETGSKLPVSKLQNTWVPVMCYSLATSSLRSDSNAALVVLTCFFNCSWNQWEWQHFLPRWSQTDSLPWSCRPLLFSVLWNYSCQFKNNTKYSRTITLLYKWGYKAQGSTDLFQAIRAVPSSMDDNFFYVSWWQDQTINFCHLCATCSLSQNFDYRL